MDWERINEIRDDPLVEIFEDILISLMVVAGVAGLLFFVSGVWPPMVAIQSGSMEPGLVRGDLVFVVDEGKFTPDGMKAHHGIITKEVAENSSSSYEVFGKEGDVIVYYP
ncbi:MAG: S26 family signal peptidase, partial [Halobacteria archaeon]|nr:S26 family signal peptidase [Halobacteria archaeon]